MAYLIDGHNLIPNIPGLSLSAPDDEERLIVLLQAFSRAERRQVEVYFDNAPPGQAGERRYGLVKAHFTRAGMTADQAIRDRLQRLGRSARNWTVVTSDREVQAAARERHASVMESRQFARRLTQPSNSRIMLDKREHGDLSQEEIDDWLRLFGKKPE